MALFLKTLNPFHLRLRRVLLPPPSIGLLSSSPKIADDTESRMCHLDNSDDNDDIYRPTVRYCNDKILKNLRHSRYSDLFSFHRIMTKASIAPTIVTHNILLQAYCDSGKTDTALEHYRQDNSKIEQAVELKDDMLAKGFCRPDPTLYNQLMAGFIEKDEPEPDRVLALYDELKEKLGGGQILDGIVYGSLMRAFFEKGAEAEAMEVFSEVLGGEGSKVRFDAVCYNLVLDALGSNGKLD